MRKYKIFDKIHSFLKHFSNVLNSKKGDYIFEESLNLHVIVVSFFSLPLWIPKENTAELEKLFNLNSRLRWGANPPDTQYFLSIIAVMQVNF